MNEKEIDKLHAMINIVVANSINVVKEANKLENDKLIISELADVELEKIETVINHTEMAFHILCSKGKKAYGVAYELIFQNLVSIRELGGYDNDFQIALQGTLKLGEL